MYQLVFKGQCVAGVDVSKARANVAQVFKASQAQLDRMFSGERVIIRNKLDSDTAGKYQAALSKQGIIVHIEPMLPQADAPAPVNRPTQSAAAVRETESSVGDQANPSGPGPMVEPGERLPVAGERVDQVLAGSGLTLARPGENLGQSRQLEGPVPDHPEEWSLAPVGEILVEPVAKPTAVVPDISHLQVLPASEG